MLCGILVLKYCDFHYHYPYADVITVLIVGSGYSANMNGDISGHFGFAVDTAGDDYRDGFGAWIVIDMRDSEVLSSSRVFCLVVAWMLRTECMNFAQVCS